MLAENLFGFPNWCGFWKWVLWTRLPTFLQSIIEKGTICSPYSWNSWIFTVFCCRLSRLNMAWRTHLAICVMHFQPPVCSRFVNRSPFSLESVQKSQKLQPWSARICAPVCLHHQPNCSHGVLILVRLCLYCQPNCNHGKLVLVCVCLNCLLNSSHGLRYLCICVCYCQPPNCSGVWWARLGQKLVSKWSKYCDRYVQHQFVVRKQRKV